MSRGEPAQPKSEPVKETEAEVNKNAKGVAYYREMALQIALGIPRAEPSVTQLLADAKAIELYLKGEAE